MAPAMAGAVPTVATRKQFAGIGVGNLRGTSHGPTASAGPVAPPTGNATEEAEYKRVTPRYGDGDRWTKECAGNEGAEARAPRKVDPQGSPDACPGTDSGDEPTATAEAEEAARDAAVMICTSSAAPARSMCSTPGRMILHDDILPAGDAARGPVAVLKGTTTTDPMGTVQEAAAAGCGATRRRISRHRLQAASSAPAPPLLPALPAAVLVEPPGPPPAVAAAAAAPPTAEE